MNNPPTMWEVEQQYHHLVKQKQYAEAHKLITENVGIFDHHAQKIVYYWLFWTAVMLNETDLTIQLLAKAVDDGHWYSGLAENADFAQVHQDPRFVALVQICQKRREEVMKTAVPTLKRLQPPNHPQPHPLLFALHGNNSNVETFAKGWETAVPHGWLVGLPQSSQIREPGVYTWNDWDWAIEEIQQQFTTLCADHSVNCQQAVLAGYSMGGGLAVSLVLSGKIKPKGLILIAPFLNNADNMIPYLETRAADDLRAYIVVTEQDIYCRDIGQRLSQLLPQYGIPCQFEIYPNLGHSFPPTFAQKLPKILDFVMV